MNKTNLSNTTQVNKPLSESKSRYLMAKRTFQLLARLPRVHQSDRLAKVEYCKTGYIVARIQFEQDAIEVILVEEQEFKEPLEKT